ncbi:PIN domain-like protein [Earliella scabrosa]|nr:PIN domain-like protein [Earliella scabrosa]
MCCQPYPLLLILFLWSFNSYVRSSRKLQLSPHNRNNVLPSPTPTFFKFYLRRTAMGVKNFWKVVEAAVEKPSLRTLSIREGFERHSGRLYCIGVDVSIWMRQFQHSFAVGHVQSGENPELRAFFYRLAMLAERPVHLVFVSDGAARPSVKRGKQVKKTPHWLEDGMRRISAAFGFPWLVAAGEAEAELAAMNALGIIDAVMTDDSDAFLFGARVVIRNPDFKRDGPDHVELYRASEILDKVRIGRGSMILLALLTGCDYDTKGLAQCGMQTAVGLLRYRLGPALVSRVTEARSDDELTRSLDDWCSTFKLRLRCDPNGFIGRARPALAKAVPAAFPNPDIVRQFMSPALLDVHAYDALRRPRILDIAQIGVLCETHFSFGSRVEIMKTFRKTLWHDEVMRMLVNEGLHRAGQEVDMRNLLNIAVIKIEELASTGYTLAHLRISDNGFNDLATSKLHQSRAYRVGVKASEADALDEAQRPLNIKMPVLIVERARPRLVNPDYDVEGYLYGHVNTP